MPVSPAVVATQTERIEQRIKAHKEEVARLRAELGDPAAALDRWVVENFTLEAFFPDPPSMAQPWEVWDEDDDLSAR